MRIDELKPPLATKPGKRVGRGVGSGRGKTSGRGMSGQKSRSGFNIPANFEGGQSTLISRLPKRRGFKTAGRKYISFSITRILDLYKTGEQISPDSLVEKGLIKNKKLPVKLFGTTDKTVAIKDCKVSKSLEKFVTA